MKYGRRELRWVVLVVSVRVRVLLLVVGMLMRMLRGREMNDERWAIARRDGSSMCGKESLVSQNEEKRWRDTCRIMKEMRSVQVKSEKEGE